MVSTVKSRPTHYEVLGLKPDATGDEIARAFAREMGRPRALGGLAGISVAYETLRDPARRRAYDDSLRPKPPEPEPGPPPKSPWAASPYLLRAAAHPAEPQVEPRPPSPMRAEAPGETSLPPSIAKALRELAEPVAAGPEPQAEAPRPPETQAEPEPEPPISDTDRDAPQEPLHDVEEGSVDWRRPAAAAGVLVAAAAVVGGVAGWWSGDGPQPQAQAQARTEVLPPPTTFTVDDPAPAAASPAPLQGEVVVPLPPAEQRALAAAPIAPRRAPAQRTASSERLAEIAEAIQAPTGETAAQPAAAEAAAAEAPPVASAAMPLPNRVIARTIRRIGYPCGEVASTTAVDGGAAGVFTVTCTSGHSYRAAPVRGRYRFRRVAG